MLMREATGIARGQLPAAIAASGFDDFDFAHVFCRTIFVMILQLHRVATTSSGSTVTVACRPRTQRSPCFGR
jgi:hypothetical protein